MSTRNRLDGENDVLLADAKRAFFLGYKQAIGFIGKIALELSLGNNSVKLATY